MLRQNEDGMETLRQRLLWLLWGGLVLAMALSLVFFSNLLGAIDDTLEDRVKRQRYQHWIAAELDLDFVSLQDTLQLARQEGVAWNASAVLGVSLIELSDSATRLQASAEAQEFSAEKPVVARLLRAQQDFLERYVSFAENSHRPSAEDIDRMSADLAQLAHLRRILIQDLMRNEVSQGEQDNMTLQARLRSVYSSGSAVLVFLGGLLVINVLMLATLRRRRQALDRAMKSMRTIVEASRDTVFVADDELTVTAMGKTGERMFRLHENEALGRPLFDFFANDRSEFDLFSAALQEGSGSKRGEYRVELNGRRSDGSSFPANVSFSVAREAGRATGYVISIADMTEQVDRELSLMQARNEALQAERAKSRFLASMSHEMRTPLNGVLASLDLMRETTTLNERQEELVKIIERCGDDALEQVENVLELTRLDTLANTAINVAPFAPVALLREIVETNQQRAQQGRNTLRFDSAVPDNLFVTGSAILFRQIMHNFVSNAVKFTSDGEIRAKLTAMDLGHEIEFTASVQDTGIGIEAEDLDRIFRNFETIRDSYSHFRSGTGLGLSIAKHSADLLNARIEVDSQPGQGSRFTLVVNWPKGAEDQTAELNPWLETPTTRGHALDVLVVEDNEINRQMLVDMLQAKGHNVVQAVDGLEGVSVGRDHAFDLILMDISMPKLDGVGATRMLRQFGKSRQTPIVAVTAHSQPEHMREFLAAGMDRVLTKPLRMATLEQLFEDLNMSGVAEPVCIEPETQMAPSEELVPDAMTMVAAHEYETANAEVLERPEVDGPSHAADVAKVDLNETEEEETMADNLIDKDVFDGLIDMLGGESVVGYLAQFENDAVEMLPKYETAIDAADFATARAEAHRCAGGAAVIGAGKVHEVLQGMTHAADAGDAEKCRALSASLISLTQQTMGAMRQTIG
jgi:PAS domain S-box-containing protein